MAENLLTDAKVRTAALDRDGPYLKDGGGLRIRLLKPSQKHPRGARLAEYHFKLKDGDAYKNGAIHLGTIGDPFTDASGNTRGFTLADARRARDAARELVSRGIDPRQAQRLADAEAVEAQRQRLAHLDGRATVEQAVDRWVALYLEAHRKDGGAYVLATFKRHVFPKLGPVPLEALQRRQVADLLGAIAESGRRRTANVVLTLLRQFLKWCLVTDRLKVDPTAGLTKLAAGGRERSRERVLSALEIVKLRDALPAAKLPLRVRHAIWVLLATGVRVGELSSARRADFDLKAGTWQIPETKNGKPHLVHLSEFAVQHVRALQEMAGKSVFLLPARERQPDDGQEAGPDRCITYSGIGKLIADRQREVPLKRRTKETGALALPRGKWTPHDLRRTMATRMRDLGVSSDVIERCLNHTPQGIVGVYQRGDLLADRAAAFDAWGAELERLMKMDATNVVEMSSKAA